MPLSLNINNYGDIQRVLATALQRGAGRLALESEGAAHYWRQRAYKYRKLLIDQQWQALGCPIGHVPSTPYDNMILTVNGTNVLIEFRVSVGTLFDPDTGERLDLSDTPIPSIPATDDDDLLSSAIDLVLEEEKDFPNEDK